MADSTDGGVNWRPPVTIQTSVNARRYHPWVCATCGSAFVTWYDRRAATTANNDLTDYFAASAGLSAGNLVANSDEFKISATSDPQCTTWPAAPRSPFDSENCSQPQNAGVCKLVPAPSPDPSTNTRCDFTGTGGVSRCRGHHETSSIPLWCARHPRRSRIPALLRRTSTTPLLFPPPSLLVELQRGSPIKPVTFTIGNTELLRHH